MASFGRDIGSALRALRQTPGVTAIALLSLALGIGANTAIFSLLNAVVLRSLPVPQPEQLVALATTIPDSVNGDQPLSLQMFEELKRGQRVFSNVFAWRGGDISNFEGAGRHFTAALAAVSGEYYPAMRIAPAFGRFIANNDVALNSGSSNVVAVISYRAWRAWYGRDPHIVGKTLRIENQPFTIVGVEPEGYSGLIIDGATDVTIPLFAQGPQLSRDMRDPKMLWLRVYGRLKPGIDLKKARASVETLWPHVLAATQPADFQGDRRARFFARRITLESAATGVSFLRKRFAYSLKVLLAIVAAVLLIACLNLANLSLARAAARQHESGVRAALGATVWDQIRQPILESLLLSFAGALLGLALAYWTSQALLHITWTGLVKTPLSKTPDLRVLAFTAAVAGVTGLLFAIAPAWHAATTDAMEMLRQRTRSVRSGSTRIGKGLLIAQIALSLMLVMGALLFGGTLENLRSVDVGYKRDHLLTMRLFPQAGGRNRKDSVAYYRELTEKLKSLPGVESVSYSASGPANEMEYLDLVYASARSQPVEAVDDAVGPEFFNVAGMHVLSGREFNWQDVTQNPKEVIVSQSLAERLFGKQDAVGRTINLGPLAFGNRAKIIGVVNSASLWKVESVHPMAIYQQLALQFEDGQPLVDIRTKVDPRSVKALAERAVRSLGHHYSLRTMTVEERLDSYITVQRLTAMLAAFFGAVALLIAAIGLYGLMSFHVTRRTAELGIRMALGAQRWQVIWMVLREVAVLASAGCLLGWAVSFAVKSSVSKILFGVSASDPTLFAVATLTLLGVAVIAGLLPALRAARVNPMQALRIE